MIKETNLSGDPIRAEWDICKSTTVEVDIQDPVQNNNRIQYYNHYYTQYYDPLVYIKNCLTACLEDGNLEINADKRNALKSCFSENFLKLFYITGSGTEIKVKVGSNNIYQQTTNMKSTKSHKFRIENNGKAEDFEINNTLSCAKQSKSKPKESNTPVVIVVIVSVVFGSVGSVVVVAVIYFSVIRNRKMKKTNDTDEKVDYYGNEEYAYQ